MGPKAKIDELLKICLIVYNLDSMSIRKMFECIKCSNLIAMNSTNVSSLAEVVR